MLLRLSLLTFILILSTGCSISGYEKTYRPSADVDEIIKNFDLNNGDVPVQLIRSNSLQRDVRALMTDGYGVLGTASFIGGLEDLNKLTKIGKRLGATVVVSQIEIDRKAYYRVSQSLSYDEKLALSKLQEDDKVSYFLEKIAVSSNPTELKDVQLFDQTGIFMAPLLRKPPYGLILTDASSARLTESGIKKAALVDLLVVGTDAYNGDVYSGDLITSINDTPINSKKHALNIIKDNYRAGTAITLEINRKGQNIITVLANP